VVRVSIVREGKARKQRVKRGRGGPEIAHTDAQRSSNWMLQAGRRFARCATGLLLYGRAVTEPAAREPVRPLCGLSAVELCALLRRREVSAREVVQAHLDLIAERDGELRAFTHVFRERALAEAERPQRGPLFGLPVSVKENLDIAGEATTMGVVGRQGNRASADAAMVTLLREAGAIVLGRTNLSQLCLFPESRNPLFGQTANPWSLAHSPGGSSGGEGAAIAAGLSPLGIGTDIGGSIRVPAHFCGIAGLKPTLDRWPMRGIAAGIPGQEAVRAMCGPMARSARDLLLLMQSLDARRASQLDGRVPPLAFAEEELGKPRVGLLVDDGVLPPSLAVARAVRRAAEALQKRGCEIVPWQPPRVREAIFLQIAAMSADGGDRLRRELRGQPVDPVLLSLMRVARLPALLRRGIAAAVRDELPSRTLQALGRKPVEELWRLTGEIRAWRFEVLAAMDAAGIDLIVSPPFATPALPHFGAKNALLAASPSMLWNIAQLPAGVVPVSRVRPDEARRDGARGLLERLAARIDLQSAGLPVGAQITGRPWAESRVLAAMIAVEDEVRGDPDFPRTPTPGGDRSR
jgi:fatty acid amide hydrolase